MLSLRENALNLSIPSQIVSSAKITKLHAVDVKVDSTLIATKIDVWKLTKN